jgi:hypothetical protein
MYTGCLSQWPCGLRRRSAAAFLLRLLVRIPPGAWMFICCKCCVLLGRSLCDELFTRPEEPYRLWCEVMCGLKTSRMRRPCPGLVRSAIGKKYVYRGFNLRSSTRCTTESDETVWKDIAVLQLKYAVNVSHDRRRDTKSCAKYLNMICITL